MPNIKITTWAAFEAIFLEKYFLNNLKGANAREFMNLIQKCLSVTTHYHHHHDVVRCTRVVPNTR